MPFFSQVQVQVVWKLNHVDTHPVLFVGQTLISFIQPPTCNPMWWTLGLYLPTSCLFCPARVWWSKLICISLATPQTFVGFLSHQPIILLCRKSQLFVHHWISSKTWHLSTRQTVWLMFSKETTSQESRIKFMSQNNNAEGLELPYVCLWIDEKLFPWH